MLFSGGKGFGQFLSVNTQEVCDARDRKFTSGFDRYSLCDDIQATNKPDKDRIKMSLLDVTYCVKSRKVSILMAACAWC